MVLVLVWFVRFAKNLHSLQFGVSKTCFGVVCGGLFVTVGVGRWDFFLERIMADLGCSLFRTCYRVLRQGLELK